jgi:vitellogenic carboxypeptidase-like protein
VYIAPFLTILSLSLSLPPSLSFLRLPPLMTTPKGQFDWKDGPFANEKWIAQMNWEGKDQYLATPRTIWLSPSSSFTSSSSANRVSTLVPSGWVQSTGLLTELVVNGAGHLAPMDQPERLLSMITTFVENLPF